MSHQFAVAWGPVSACAGAYNESGLSSTCLADESAVQLVPTWTALESICLSSQIFFFLLHFSTPCGVWSGLGLGKGGA